MSDLTPETLTELRRLLNAATPGPWRADGDAWIEAGSYDEVLTPAPVECMAYCYGGASRVNLADVDRALIVAAVNALPDILADLEDAESLTAALRLAQARAADAETETRLLKGEVRVWRDLALRNASSTLAAELDALTAKVERVRALHGPGRKFTRPGGHDQFCACGLQHPCPTIRAIDESEADR